MQSLVILVLRFGKGVFQQKLIFCIIVYKLSTYTKSDA